MKYAYAAAGGLILTFIFLILRKKDKSFADYLLVLLNLVIALFLLTDVLVQEKLSSFSIILQNVLPLLLFPVFILYVFQFIKAGQNVHHNWYLIFLPGLILLAYSLYDHFILDSYPSQKELLEHFNQPKLQYHIIFKGSQLIFIFVLIHVLRSLHTFHDELRKGYSTLDTIEVSWLKHFAIIYLGAIVITFVLFLSQNFGLIPFDVQQVFAIIYGLLVCSVFYLNYQGIQHYTLAEYKRERQSTLVQSTEKTEILNDKEQLLEKEIFELIDQKQLYLESKFSLNDLAEYVGANRHLVSKIINSQADRSFYDLINKFRVNHLVKELQNPKNSHLTILALGLRSGFNSKASMNRIFKKNTGSSPKDFVEQSTGRS